MMERRWILQDCLSRAIMPGGVRKILDQGELDGRSVNSGGYEPSFVKVMWRRQSFWMRERSRGCSRVGAHSDSRANGLVEGLQGDMSHRNRLRTSSKWLLQRVRWESEE